MPDLLPYFLCAAAYAAQAVVLWPGRANCERANFWRWMPLIPLLLHVWLLANTVLAGGAVNLGFASMLSAVTALSVLVYGMASWRYCLGGMQGVVLAIAAGAVLLQGVMGMGHEIAHSQAPAFRAHLLMSITAYSLFLIAAVHALFLLWAEKAMHQPTVITSQTGLPPLLTLEALLFRLIEAGFMVLTLTLLTGVFFAEETFGRPFPLTHMTVFGVLSWLVFAGLLLGRHLRGWRGRRAVSWTLAGFVMLFLAYMGAQLVLEFLLHRA